MTYKIPKVKSVWLKDHRNLNASAHPVFECHLTKLGKEVLGLDDTTLVYTKQASRIERQEETAFSALYRMDIGQSAAKTLLYADKAREIGIASIGLNQFIEYWKLHDKEKSQAYQKKYGIDIKSTVFNLDNNGKPKSIKHVKGLASVMMSSWLYAEDDFHCGNFGLARNDKNELIWARLDFGMSFSSITNEAGRPFREQTSDFERVTLKDLQQFPDVEDAKPFYWPTRLNLFNHDLNFRGSQKHNAYHHRDKELFRALKNNPEFINEKYEFLLKQFLIDVDQKTALIRANIDAPKSERLATTIASRIEKLRCAALADSGFRAYVKRLSAQKRQDLLTSLANDNQNLVEGDLKARYQTNLAILEDNIKVFETESEGDLLGQQQYIDIIFDGEDIVLKLKSDLVAAKKQNLDSQDELQRQMLRAQQKVNSYYARYLGAAGSDKAELSRRLSVLHAIIVRRSVLEPVNRLIIGPGTESTVLNAFFRKLRANWLLPNLVHKNLNDLEVDALFQNDVLLRLRNIEQLFSDFSQYQDKVQLNRVVANFNKDIDKKLSAGQVKDHLKTLEQELIQLKYKQTVFSDFTKPIENGSENHTALSALKLAGNLLHYSKTTLLAEFIGEQYSQGAMLVEVESSSFIGDLKRVETITEHFLNQEFFDKYHTKKLDPATKHFFEIGLGRLEQLYKQYNLDASGHNYRRLPLAQQQEFIKALSFVLSRLALDLQRTQARADLANGLYAKGLNFQEAELKKGFMEQMINANYQLSSAMAKPSYHDSNAISQVAEAGLLAALALQSPTAQTAAACLEHVEKLTNSHVTRFATKVAFALAAISFICLSLTTWALTLSVPMTLPIIGVISKAILADLSIASGLTFFGSASYGAKRYFYDQDKVSRYMGRFAEVAQAGVIDTESEEIAEEFPQAPDEPSVQQPIVF